MWIYVAFWPCFLCCMPLVHIHRHTKHSLASLAPDLTCLTCRRTSWGCMLGGGAEKGACWWPGGHLRSVNSVHWCVMSINLSDHRSIACLNATLHCNHQLASMHCYVSLFSSSPQHNRLRAERLLLRSRCAFNYTHRCLPCRHPLPPLSTPTGVQSAYPLSVSQAEQQLMLYLDNLYVVSPYQVSTQTTEVR